jgi:hypothetical protein
VNDNFHVNPLINQNVKISHEADTETESQGDCRQVV